MSSFNFSKKIALRYLWSKRAEAFISIITVFAIIGVAVGVAVLNITMSIMTGFEHELRSKIVGDSHIVVYKFGDSINSWQDVLLEIKKNKDVVAASPFTQNQALISIAGKSRGVMVKGIQSSGELASKLEGYLMNRSDLKYVFNGDENDSNDSLPGIVLGQELFNQLGIIPGTKVSILSSQTSSTPFGLSPRFRRFSARSSYQSGLSAYEEALAYVDLKEAQKFFKTGDSISGVEIMVSDIDNSSLTAESIRNALTSRFGGGFYAQDWTQSNKELWEALKLEKQVYFIVLLLLIVLASFSIVSTLIMIVMEKRKDIAVMKTLGASTSSIAQIFRIQGAVIGLCGTIGGSVIGYLSCIALKHYGFPLPENVFPTDVVPVLISPMNFCIVAVSAFLICLLSTWYPARRASQVEPSEALRYE